VVATVVVLVTSGEAVVPAVVAASSSAPHAPNTNPATSRGTRQLRMFNLPRAGPKPGPEAPPPGRRRRFPADTAPLSE